MYLLVLYFPLINSLVCGLFGHFLEKRGAMFITTFNMFCGTICGFFTFLEVLYYDVIVEIELVT